MKKIIILFIVLLISPALYGFDWNSHKITVDNKDVIEKGDVDLSKYLHNLSTEDYQLFIENNKIEQGVNHVEEGMVTNDSQTDDV